MATPPQDPITALWERLMNGELTEAGACALARAPDVSARLTLDDVVRASDTAERLTREHGYPALRLHRVTLAAVESATDADADRMRREAAMAWLEVVTRAVRDVADGRVFRDAVARGERLVADAAARGDGDEAALALFRLGVLHLDPYTAGRSPTNYEAEIQQWQARPRDTLGTALAGVPGAEWRMPAPKDALRTAEGYLRRATQSGKDRDRARALKALAQALEWRQWLGEPVEDAAIGGPLREALAALDPREHPRDCAGALAMLDRHGGQVPREVLDALTETPLDVWVTRLGPAAALDLAVQLIALLHRRDPARALAVIRATHALAAERDDPGMRSRLWILELTAMLHARVPDVDVDADTRGLAATAQALRARGRREGWSNDTLALALVLLAARAPQLDDEPTGLALMKDAVAHAPALADTHSDALTSVYATLFLGVAVNAVNAGRFTDAAPWYGRALAAYLTIGFVPHALECLRRLEDVVGRGDEDTATQVMATLAAHGVALEGRIGDVAGARVQQLCGRTIAALVARDSVKTELVNLILNVAKGVRFAAALLRPRPYDYRDDPAAMAQLARIAEATRALPPAPPEDQPGALPAASLVVAYVGTTERLPGRDPRETVENLQIGFDDYVSRRLLRDVEASRGLYPSVADIQAALDERTVVVTYLFAPTPTGEVGILILALSRDGEAAAMGQGDVPSSTVEMSAGGRTVAIPFLGVGVQGVLEAIEADPTSGPVAATVAEHLRAGGAQYLGGTIGPFLAAQRARGRDHLCVVPHGPLHYLPFHLLGAPGQPLADEWIVTTLPNVRLLTRQPGDRPARAAAGAALGLGFTAPTPWGLEPIPEAIEEAVAVARAFGGTAIVDDAATQAAAVDALETARRVHIATHSAHHFSAPAFQRLYLAPDAASDGILHAYEVLALDLRGLELLTLGACETALGRFDRSDNLRGLPASFLLAGAATVVGTLWKVETTAARRFFTRLYERVTAGDSRLDAFAAAQRETRAHHPEYRDWGAFYLMGQWS